MVLIGTRAMMAYMISGTDGASNTPNALALVTKLMPRCSGKPACRNSGNSSPPNAKMVTPEMKKRVEAAKSDIVSGKVKVADYMADNACKF